MYQPEGEGRARARRIISGAGYKCGGHFAKGGGIRADEIADKLEITKAIHEHEGALHPGSKKTRLRLATGGVAGGGMPMGRADRASRGRKEKEPKTHVNILIAPQGDKAGTEGPPPGGPMIGGPMMGGPGGPPPGPPPVPRPPPPPMAPPTGASPMGVGAPMGGAPPMMRKAGGRTGRRRLQDGGMSGDDNEGMQVGGMPGGLPPATGGGLRRSLGLGPPGWAGNSPAAEAQYAQAMQARGGLPSMGPTAAGQQAQAAMQAMRNAPTALQQMPAGATGGGPSSMSMMPSAGAGPGMGTPGQLPAGMSMAPPPGAGTMPAGATGGGPSSMSMMPSAGAGPGMGAPSAGPGMGAPPPLGPPPPAKRGGRISHKAGGRTGRYSPPDMEAGAGSGAGRLDKIGKDEPSYGR